MPDSIQVEKATTDATIGALFPEEESYIAGAVLRRRREFTTVRACARQALGRLGYPPMPILPAPSREPSWPEGVVGSLTHCEGYRAAAVARDTDFASIGIDAEIHAWLPSGVIDQITVGDEKDMLSDLAAVNREIAWGRVLFSAKESIFKAFFPLARTWLDFTECELTISPDGVFEGELKVPGPVVGSRRVQRLTGRWAARDIHVLTAVWVPADTPPQN